MHQDKRRQHACSVCVWFDRLEAKYNQLFFVLSFFLSSFLFYSQSVDVHRATTFHPKKFFFSLFHLSFALTHSIAETNIYTWLSQILFSLVSWHDPSPSAGHSVFFSPHKYDYTMHAFKAFLFVCVYTSSWVLVTFYRMVIVVARIT